ncbi:YciI family protein [Fimbriiglobus ruber]|uniref:PhnB protein n=1 Tax=Fimbriiglobus ruber TaxID=1908690 RepID=A0A225DGT1_9BACT|nr:YciI family protein [Fimbriiglobus ruber]OWK36586.1 PhnB protein [Fimbriiglobus ruber]
MRFLMLYKPADNAASEAGVPPTQDEIARMGTFIGEMVQEGVLLTTEGCQPSSKGARVRSAGERFAVTDGPFTETKELIAGFAIVRVNSKDEAVAAAKRFLKVAGDGECEIHQLHEMPALPPQN